MSLRLLRRALILFFVYPIGITVYIVGIFGFKLKGLLSSYVALSDIKVLHIEEPEDLN
jgi:hypothetical protein